MLRPLAIEAPLPLISVRFTRFGGFRLCRQLRFQRRDPRLQQQVLFAGQRRHGLYRLKLLTRRQIETGKPALGALLEQSIDFGPDALGSARGIGNQFGQIIEKAVFGLHGGPLSGICEHPV